MDTEQQLLTQMTSNVYAAKCVCLYIHVPVFDSVK